MPISNLPTVSTLSSSDSLPIASVSLGSDARATLGTFLTWLLQQLSSSGSYQTQYAAPNATGFTVVIAPAVNGGSVYLLLTPVGAYANGAITLPAQATCVDGQELLVHSTQAVAALAINGNGANAVNGAPAALAQFGFFRLRYDAISKSWYRVG